MLRSEYHISKMDCPSEESLVRLKLEGLTHIKKLEFDIEKRKLVVYHDHIAKEIDKRLQDLNLGAQLKETNEVDMDTVLPDSDLIQKRLLWTVLIINISFFLIEMITGIVSNSMGLVADSLDMFADASVYGLSLWAVGSALSRKKMVARISGYFQILLALIGLIEIIRRFLYADILPDYKFMIGVSIMALIANTACLYLLQKSKSQEAHMKASMIFTSNDIIINAGVILAGVLVLFTNSIYPDLIVGSVVFLIVFRGAIRILKLGKQERYNK